MMSRQWLFMSLSVFRNKRDRNKLQRQLSKIEKEIVELRAPPKELADH